MDNAPAVVERRVMDLQETAMTVDRVVGQVVLIQQVMERVMKSGEHYGTIPGCGPKPTLLKPGAEKLSTTFRLAPYYDGEREPIDLGNGHVQYIIKCTLRHIMTDQVFGQGVGSCSTMEAKYRYRNSERKCPKCGNETIIKGKEEYGGGWICYSKKGGCGAKFKEKDAAIEHQTTGRVEHDNPADYYNTVLKMAKKRAHVDAVLTATAASDIFTQDVEDMVENGKIPENGHPEPEPAKPAPRGGFKEFLRLMTEMKAQVGDEVYYSILGANGVEHSNEIKDRNAQVKVYKELQASLASATIDEVFQPDQAN